MLTEISFNCAPLNGLPPRSHSRRFKAYRHLRVIACRHAAKQLKNSATSTKLARNRRLRGLGPEGRGYHMATSYALRWAINE